MSWAMIDSKSSIRTVCSEGGSPSPQSAPNHTSSNRQESTPVGQAMMNGKAAGSATMVTFGKIENDVEVVRMRSPTDSLSNGAPGS